jgi:hypothetical protein
LPRLDTSTAAPTIAPIDTLRSVLTGVLDQYGIHRAVLLANSMSAEHIMNDNPPSRIAELLGDTLRVVMETYAHSSRSDKHNSAARRWDNKELQE